MIYTIISRLPFITSDKSNRKFFKIFVIGSLLYVLLHYYLFQGAHDGILETIKLYLYYIMVADFGTAYAIEYFLNPLPSSEEITLPNNTPQKLTQTQQPPQQQPSQQPNKYTPEQMADLEKKYIQWRAQQDFAKKKEQLSENKNNQQTNQNDTDFDNNEENDLPKLNKKQQQSEHSHKSETSKKYNIEDTDIPRFVNQHK